MARIVTSIVEVLGVAALIWILAPLAVRASHGEFRGMGRPDQYEDDA